MNAKEVIEKIRKFNGLNVLVIGDVMLDKYVWGGVTRISPEAPVQIVNVSNEDFAPGGAANVANNIVSLGAKATILGVAGNDEAKSILVSELGKRGINTKGIIVDSNRPTTTKIRIMAHNQQLLRMDYEKRHQIEEGIHEKITGFLKSTISQYDLVIISDYLKGVITKDIVNSINEICGKHNKKIVVDPKPKNMGLYRNAFIITPNHIEASVFSGIEEENNSHINLIGEKIQRDLDANVLITRGEKGMALFEKGRDPVHIPAKAKEVYDVTGAGDTVVAALALSVASGSSLKTASLISNYAAGIVIGKLGTSSVTQEELIKAINQDKKSEQ